MYLVLLIAIISWKVVAQETPQPNKSPSAKTEPTIEQRLDCFSYSSSVAGSKFYFPSLYKIYALVNSGLPSRRNSVIPLYRHAVIEIDLGRGKVAVMPGFSSSLPRTALLLPHGNPMSGYSGIVFVKGEPDCRRGSAQLFQSSTDSKGNIRALNKNVALVHSRAVPQLFDFNSRHMLSLDMQLLQFRKLAGALAKDETPIYVDHGKRMLYTFSDSKNFRGIINRSGREQKRLPLVAGSKILQQRHLFGQGRIIPSKNRLEIREFPRWSGEGTKKKRYIIELPKRYRFEDAQLVIDFTRKIIVIGAGVTLAKREWRKVFYYDYRRGKLITELTMTDQQLADTIAIDQHDQRVVTDIIQQNTGRTEHIALFDLEKRNLRKIAVQRRQKPPKKASPQKRRSTKKTPTKKSPTKSTPKSPLDALDSLK